MLDRNCGVHISDLFDEDETGLMKAIETTFGFDPAGIPLFWEHFVARMVGGIVTDHRATHDVEVEIWGRICRIEVKFSKAFFCKFGRIRGKDWSRLVLKWAVPRGYSGKMSADAIVLIGVDCDGLVHSWVVPREAIHPHCSSITLGAPSIRKEGSNNGPMDRWHGPTTELLPRIADCCHNRHDAKTRAAGIRQRRRAVMKCDDMFQE